MSDFKPPLWAVGVAVLFVYGIFAYRYGIETASVIFGAALAITLFVGIAGWLWGDIRSTGVDTDV